MKSKRTIVPSGTPLGITSDAGAMTAGLTPSISFITMADIISLGSMFNLKKILSNGEN